MMSINVIQFVTKDEFEKWRPMFEEGSFTEDMDDARGVLDIKGKIGGCRMTLIYEKGE